MAWMLNGILLCFPILKPGALQGWRVALRRLPVEQQSVLRMGRAFPFKQGGQSLFAVLAPMATQWISIMNIHKSPKRSLTMDQWCQRCLECSTVFLLDCVALLDSNWPGTCWKEHPPSSMTFPSSWYCRPSPHPSQVTLRWLSSSFFHFCARWRRGTGMNIEDAVATRGVRRAWGHMHAVRQCYHEHECCLSSVSLEPRWSMSCVAGFLGFTSAPDCSLSQTNGARGWQEVQPAPPQPKNLDLFNSTRCVSMS